MNKSIKKTTQLKTIFHFFSKNTATVTMASKATGIPRPNITRYKRDLEKKGLLSEIERKLCQVTGFRAWYLTANPDLSPETNQVKSE